MKNGLCLFALVLVAVNSFSENAGAMGRGNPANPEPGREQPNPLPTMPPIVGGALKKNPYVMALMNQYEKGLNPVSEGPDGMPVWSDRIEMGRRYNCRVYYALAKNDSSGGGNMSTSTWYEFQRFGVMILSNVASLDTGAIRDFAPNPELDMALWGQRNDQKYFEAIKVMPNNDLIIEAYSPKPSWAEVILNLIKAYTTKNYETLISAAADYAIQTTVLGTDGFVNSYTYCPSNQTMTVEEMDLAVLRGL